MGETVTAGVVVSDVVHPFLDGTTVLDLVRQGLPRAPRWLRPRPAGRFPPEWYDAPAFSLTSPHALIGAYDDVAVPPGCELLDFELEVAAVVASDGRDLAPMAAALALFGDTIFNDWLARDLQRREMKVGLGPCKGKDFASTLGPWLVTADELEPYLDEEGRLALTMTVQVNGRELSRDLLSNMAWTFAELWGRSGKQEPAPLQPADVVTMTVEGIGTIANRVVPGPAAIAVPRATPRRSCLCP